MLKSILFWVYTAYLGFMAVVLGGVLISVNIYHYNPIHINEDKGAQFLLGYMTLLCIFCLFILLRSYKTSAYDLDNCN